jgi:membrane-associated phospholipid phosphatase
MNLRTETASPLSGRFRRLVLFYVASLMGSLQVVFGLVEYGGFDFEPRMMVWIIPAILPISVAALWVFSEEPQASAREPSQWIQWGLVAAMMFAIWAGLYFLVGRFTDPSRVRYLPALFESTIPFRPSYTILYVLLYPIFLLPFFAVRDRLAFQRLVSADLLMFATCTATFLAIPVAFDRPPLPLGPTDFSAWVLALVRGSDPPWNCLPSEHCAAAMVAALATWEADRKMGAFAFFTTILIGISTLFTKQHYLVDVLSGYGVAASIHFALRWSHSFEAEPRLGGVLDRLDRLLNR